MFIWGGEFWNSVISRMEKEPSVSRTQSKIQERALSKSSERPRAINYFCNELHDRHLMDSEYACGFVPAAYELEQDE